MSFSSERFVCLFPFELRLRVRTLLVGVSPRLPPCRVCLAPLLLAPLGVRLRLAASLSLPRTARFSRERHPASGNGSLILTRHYHKSAIQRTHGGRQPHPGPRRGNHTTQPDTSRSPCPLRLESGVFLVFSSVSFRCYWRALVRESFHESMRGGCPSSCFRRSLIWSSRCSSFVRVLRRDCASSEVPNYTSSAAR